MLFNGLPLYSLLRLLAVPKAKQALPFLLKMSVNCCVKAFSDYQRQLWDPLSVPVGLDMNDVGYARGGAGIDSDGFVDANAGDGGEWHFHVYGEMVGLFALDVRHGNAGLQVRRAAPNKANVSPWLFIFSSWHGDGVSFPPPRYRKMDLNLTCSCRSQGVGSRFSIAF